MMTIAEYFLRDTRVMEVESVALVGEVSVHCEIDICDTSICSSHGVDLGRVDVYKLLGSIRYSESLFTRYTKRVVDCCHENVVEVVVRERYLLYNRRGTMVDAQQESLKSASFSSVCLRVQFECRSAHDSKG